MQFRGAFILWQEPKEFLEALNLDSKIRRAFWQRFLLFNVLFITAALFLRPADATLPLCAALIIAPPAAWLVSWLPIYWNFSRPAICIWGSRINVNRRSINELYRSRDFAGHYWKGTGRLYILNLQFLEAVANGYVTQLSLGLPDEETKGWLETWRRDFPRLPQVVRQIADYRKWVSYGHEKARAKEARARCEAKNDAFGAKKGPRFSKLIEKRG